MAAAARLAVAAADPGRLAPPWNVRLGAVERGAAGARLPGHPQQRTEPPRALAGRRARAEEAAAAPGAGGHRGREQLHRHRQPGGLVHGRGHLLC